MEERFYLKGDLTVIDQETKLMWQRGTSTDRMVWKDGFVYVDKLNQVEFAGYSDWRYPSKEELATLILSEEDRHSGLFLPSLFGKQRCCWSSTEMDHHRACYADFYYGDIYVIEGNYANYAVRAVRNHRE